MKLKIIAILLLYVNNADSVIFSAIVGVAGIVSDAINSALVRKQVNKAIDAAKAAEDQAYKSYLEAKLAKEKAAEVGKDVKDLKKMLPEEMEKTRDLINGMIKQHEKNHQEVLGTLYNMEQGVRDLKKAIALLQIEEANIELTDREFVDTLGEFLKQAQQLDSLYRRFSDYAPKPDKYNRRTLENFIVKNMAGDTLDLMRSFTSKLVSSRGLFDLSLDVQVEKYILSTRKISVLQFMQNLFSYYVLCEIRTLVVVSFAKNLESVLNPDGEGYEQEFEDYEHQAAVRLKHTLEVLQLYSSYATGRYWVYDSYKNPIGRNYVSFTNFMRGFVYRESTCSDVEAGSKSSSSCSIEDDNICEGELVNVDVSNSMSNASLSVIHVCFTEDDPNRNYDYVKLNVVPKTTKCNGDAKTFPHKTGCDVCFFLCHNPYANATDRYISLDEMVTNVTENIIVTGIRFSKHDGVIGLDIEQTQLDSSGLALPDTRKWIKNEGKKLFTLTPSKLNLYLGEIITKNKNQLVTGVRFEEVNDGVQLQVRYHELITCAKNNTLIARTENWITTDLTDQKVDISNKGLPNLNPNLAIKSFETFKLEVAASDFESDGAQTTVPFFDTRQVVGEPPTPLSGIGWTYKGENEYYTGYIAPFIIIRNHILDVDLKTLPTLESRSFATTTVLHITKSTYYILLISCIFMYFH